MIYCSKCGKENDDDAEFCSKCGNSLTDVRAKDTKFEKQVEDFAESVERVGKKAGKKIEQTARRFGEKTQDIGKRIEKATERAGSRVENWYDQTFGIFGPLVSSFIGLIILRLVIVGLKIGSQDTPVLGIIGDILLDYLLLIFIIFLISSYSSYLSRKYKTFRWISPIIIAILIISVSLIVVNIISVIGTDIGEPDLAKAQTEWREKYMLMIFVIVLLIGYLINVAIVAWEKDQKR
jgi:hypothetical protein